MPSSWRALLAGARFRIDGDDVVVGFENQRSHRVRIRETEDTIEVHAVVAKAAAVKDVSDLALRIWRHNRAAQLVSFRIDTRGRVHAEGWVPKSGLTAEELQHVVHRVAAESDRFEFILTGRDIE